MVLNTFANFLVIGELITVREVMELFLPYLNLTYNGKKKSFSYVICQLWNKLPLIVRQAGYLNNFKQKLMNVEL